MQMLFHKQAFPQGSLYTEKPLYTEAFTEDSFDAKAAFTHKRFYNEQLLRRSFYTGESLYRAAFTHRSVVPARDPKQCAGSKRIMYFIMLMMMMLNLGDGIDVNDDGEVDGGDDDDEDDNAADDAEDEKVDDDDVEKEDDDDDNDDDDEVRIFSFQLFFF